MLKRFLAAAAAVLVTAFTVWAAESEPPAPPADPPDQETVFVPSEDISEDFPAPFPVDI